ncbi:glycoside hydrolase family 28 protein [Flexithrix dorotheae]|uniref:glycoside hydrolase family 28 protein n=1 Tax=Flexithrix dorotheae TaxID=70993 RepID=UPI00035D6F23|nr:glycosyl hydrolase family 28-related protein [Flexithrix dorotheae]
MGRRISKLGEAYFYDKQNFQHCENSIKDSFFKLSFRLKICTILLIFVSGSSVYGQFLNVLDFGAIGDGVTDNTKNIQKAIDECSKTGEKVYFPAGEFLTGTIILKSNVTIFLSRNTKILGHTDIEKYPLLDPGIRFYGEKKAKRSLFFAKNSENISIEGEGTIDGQGATFTKPENNKIRPYLLWFANCKQISVKNVSLRNSGYWMQHYLGCEYVLIDHINVWNHSNKNNDMIDIDGCKYVTISNVVGDADDDGITIKSTSPLSSEYITITNCIISSHCNAIKCGTESTGGFKNIVISNCVVRPSLKKDVIYGKPAGISGISLELVDGGIMENISINNITMEGPEVPVFLRLGNRARKHQEDAPEPPLGRMNNINIANIIATNAGITGCAITGIPKSQIENVSLSNILIEAKGGGNAGDMMKPVEEAESKYPEATMFGQLPAYGFYIRHARGIKLNNVTLKYKEHEKRPGIILSNTAKFNFSDLDIQTAPESNAAIYVEKSKNGLITNTNHFYPSKHFLWKDERSENIKLLNSFFSEITKPIK